MARINQQVFNQSIARQVASYTDLDLTSQTGEYYQSYDTTHVANNQYIQAEGSLQVEIDNWLNEGIFDIYQKLYAIKSPDMKFFSTVHVADNNEMISGFALDLLSRGEQSIEVVGVQLINAAGKLFYCQEGDPLYLSNYGDSDSMYKATESSPIYLTWQSNLWVFPQHNNYQFGIEYLSPPNTGVLFETHTTPGEGESASETDNVPNDPNGDYNAANIGRIYIKHPSAICQKFITSLRDSDELTSPTQYMPDKYNRGLVYFVSSQLLSKRMMDMQKQIPSLDDYSTLTSDSNEFTETENSNGWQKVRFYVESEEDAELANIKMSELNGQQQSWVLKYQWYGQQKQLVDSLYMGIFNPQQGAN